MRIKIYERMKKALRRCSRADESSLNYENIKSILKNDLNATLVDVRSPQEYKEGHLEKSINLPLYDLEKSSLKQLKNKQNTIILYCQSGSRSKKAMQILKNQGYSHVYQLEGGLDNLK